jgi:hypothetical protein
MSWHWKLALSQTSAKLEKKSINVSLANISFFKSVTKFLYCHIRVSKQMLSRSPRAMLLLAKNYFATSVYVSVGVVTLFVIFFTLS